MNTRIFHVISLFITIRNERNPFQNDIFTIELVRKHNNISALYRYLIVAVSDFRNSQRNAATVCIDLVSPGALNTPYVVNFLIIFV